MSGPGRWAVSTCIPHGPPYILPLTPLPPGPSAPYLAPLTLLPPTCPPCILALTPALPLPLLQPVLTMEEMEALKALKYRAWTTKVGMGEGV